MFFENCCLFGDSGVHLAKNDGARLPSHVDWADAVLHPVTCITVLLHNADAAAGQRHVERPIAEAIVLATEGEARVREEAHCEDGLLETRGVVVVLRQTLRPVMVHIHRN